MVTSEIRLKFIVNKIINSKMSMHTYVQYNRQDVEATQYPKTEPER